MIRRLDEFVCELICCHFCHSLWILKSLIYRTLKRNVKMTANEIILLLGLKLNSLIVLWYNEEHSQRMAYLEDGVSNS